MSHNVYILFVKYVQPHVWEYVELLPEQLSCGYFFKDKTTWWLMFVMLTYALELMTKIFQVHNYLQMLIRCLVF